MTGALESLRAYTSLIDLRKGKVSAREEEEKGGIYFVETGWMKVHVLMGHMDARLPASMMDPEPSFRVARIGQGWVIGGIDATLADGLHLNTSHGGGVYTAIADCRLHHLPSNAIRELEQANPSLSVQLYKLISFLAAKGFQRPY